MKYVVVLIGFVAITAVAVMVTAGTSSSADKFRDELAEMLPVYNIMLTEAQIGKTQECTGEGGNCEEDDECCQGYNCRASFSSFPATVCLPCSTATQDCSLARTCCNGFHCVYPSLASLVGTCE